MAEYSPLPKAKQTKLRFVGGQTWRWRCSSSLLVWLLLRDSGLCFPSTDGALCLFVFASVPGIRGEEAGEPWGPSWLAFLFCGDGDFLFLAPLSPEARLTCDLASSSPASKPDQVWPLAQLYSYDITQSQTIVKKCVFSVDTIKVCAGCYWRCLGTTTRSEIHLMIESLYLWSSRRNAYQGPLKGRVSAQKAFQGSRTETRELLWGTGEKSIFLTRGHWFAIQANRWFFLQRGNRKKLS